MNLTKANKYLSLIQLIGFILIYIIISAYCIKEGRMMVYYIPIIGILFLPFIIVAYSGFNLSEIKLNQVANRIYVAMIIILLSAISLPFFYETGGFIILLVVVLLFISILLLKKNTNKQLLLFNLIGMLLLIFIIKVNLLYFLFQKVFPTFVDHHHCHGV